MTAPTAPSIACIGVIGKNVEPFSPLPCLVFHILLTIQPGQPSPHRPLPAAHEPIGRLPRVLVPAQRLARRLRPACARQEPCRPGPRPATRRRRAAQRVGLGDGNGNAVRHRAGHVGEGRRRGYWTGGQRGGAEAGEFASWADFWGSLRGLEMMDSLLTAAVLVWMRTGFQGATDGLYTVASESFLYA